MEVERIENKRLFDGSTYIKVFFIYFGNVAMKSKETPYKAMELLNYLDNDAFQF